jgi:Tfp pilus assembly protein PilF
MQEGAMNPLLFVFLRSYRRTYRCISAYGCLEKAVLLLAVLVISSTLTFAQGSEPGSLAVPHPVKLEIHGQVRLADTHRPAANILVRLDSFSGGMIGQILTDRDGKFQFSGLRSMQYVVTVRAEGYQQFQQSVDLLTATSDYVNVFLTPTSSENGSGTHRASYIDARIPAAARQAFEKAQSVLQNGNFEKAIPILEKAINIWPDFYEAQLSLGTAYMDVSNWEKAEPSLLKALQLNSQSTNALFALGELYLKMHRLDEAEKRLRNGLQLQNRSATAHFALARVYWEKNDIPATGRQLAISLQLDPNAPDPHLLAGNVFLRVRNLENALGEFREYLRLAPKGAHAAEARGMTEEIKRQLRSSNK